MVANLYPETNWPDTGVDYKREVSPLRKIFSVEEGGPSFRARFTPGKTNARPIRTFWDIKGYRLSFWEKELEGEPHSIGRLALIDCPIAPGEHGARLEYEVYKKGRVDGASPREMGVGSLAIVLGTAIALQRGIKVVCAAREIRPEVETSVLLDLGYGRTGDPFDGEFVLRHADYLREQGVGGYMGNDYLGDFVRSHKHLAASAVYNESDPEVWIEATYR